MSLEIEDLEATSVMSTLHARDEIVVEASEKTKVDNMDYSTVVMDGQERFACNNCDFKSDKIKGIKRHITTTHVVMKVVNTTKKRKSMESAKTEENAKEVKQVKVDEQLSESVWENFGKVPVTSTQVEIEEQQRMMDELEEDMKNVRQGEATEGVEENDMNELKEQYEEEKRKNIVLQGKVNELEDIKAKQKANMDRMMRIVGEYKAELDKAKAAKGGAELVKVKRELKEAKTTISELQKKVERLSTDKAKAEAEVARVMKHNSHMEEALQRTRRPETTQRSEKDCPFWTEGHCKFSGSECKRGSHKKEKFNTMQRRGVVNEEKIVSNVLEVLSRQQQRPPLGQQPLQQQQPMMMMQEMMPQQQMMTMRPQMVGPQYQQQVGFRQNPAGLQWNNGAQQHQDWMDMSMAGNNTANLRFSQ